MEKEVHPTSAEKNKYDFQAGKAYMLIGGDSQDVLTSCDGCGGPYYGQCQGACPHCEKSRKVFYADVTDVKLVESLGPERMQEATSFVLPNKDIIRAGEQSFISEAVAERIMIAYNGSANLLVGNQIGAASNGRFDTVVISDNGKGVFRYDVRIGTLVTGRGVDLVFGQNCTVDNLLTMGNTNIDAAFGFKQKNRKNTNYAEVAKIISGFLNN